MLGLVVAAALATAWPLAAGLQARAVEVSGAITGIRVVQTGSKLLGTMQLEVDWTVPNGTQAGDTFRIVVPPEVKAQEGTKLAIKDVSGAVIASGLVVGGDIVYTMTQFAEDHDDIEGTAWLNISWNTEAVTPGSTYHLHFTVGSTKFVDDVTISPEAPDAGSGKWMNWVPVPPAPQGPDDHLNWGVQSPMFGAADVGRAVTLTDSSGAGQDIVCASVHVTVFGVDAANKPVRVGWMAPSAYTAYSCTPQRVSVSFVVTTALVEHRATLGGWSSVTDMSIMEFKNTGSVTVDGVTDPVSATASQVTGGGTGHGSKIVSVGDRVWDDTNHNGIQDAGEPGLAGVTLTLTGPDGKAVTSTKGIPVAPQVSTSTGGYLFTGLPALPAGQHYTVTVDSATVPAGYLPTITGKGTASTDSSSGSAGSVDLTANAAKDLTLDFGYWKPVPGVDIQKKDAAGHDADSAGAAVELGPTVPGTTGLRFVVSNTGNEPLVNVTVSDAVIAGGQVSGLTCTFPDKSTGVTWAGPFAIGASFTCTATLTAVLPTTAHEDVATVKATGASSEKPVEDKDAYHAKVTVAPRIEIVKKDAAGHDADTAATAADLGSGKGATSLVYTVTNTGTEALVGISVKDTVVSNGTVGGMSCTFPGGSTGLTWAGPFAPGAHFACTATLSGVVPSKTPHHDTASVTGRGAYTKTVVRDTNPYYAKVPAVPAVVVVKGDVDGNAANSFADGAVLPDGSTTLRIRATNTGNESLVGVEVSDKVVRGGVVDSLTCDFSAFGGPATGTTWAGPLRPGASFPCTAVLHGLAPGDRHKDAVEVRGTGAVSGVVVHDRDPYFARRPAHQAALPHTGAQLDGALSTAAILLGAGLGLVGAATRRRLRQGR